MTPHIAKALQALFPGTKPGVDYVLQDDGDGPYIREWNLESPQPSEIEIDAMGTKIEKDLIK